MCRPVRVSQSGLSPRVRGNLCYVSYNPHSPGSIPACAGEPHEDLLDQMIDNGLSPRVRGNLRHRVQVICR